MKIHELLKEVTPFNNSLIHVLDINYKEYLRTLRLAQKVIEVLSNTKSFDEKFNYEDFLGKQQNRFKDFSEIPFRFPDSDLQPVIDKTKEILEYIKNNI